jgi:hypothetical protein
MSDVGAPDIPVFEVENEIMVAASPQKVYAVVSDLPRSAEWSVECTGGEWVSGTPGTVGAVFRGHNYRPTEVVAWAPVVRGTWDTESQVHAAEPNHTFAWAMRTKAGQKQESIWSFHIRPTDGGSILTHRFWMGKPTEGIRGITADMDDDERDRFFREWTEKLRGDMTATLGRIKEVIEKE